MKQAILICLSLCLCSFAQAQELGYIPNHPQYFNDGDTWAFGEMLQPRYLSLLDDGPNYFWVEVEYCFLDGDTIVDGYQYWKQYEGVCNVRVANQAALELGRVKYRYDVWAEPKFVSLIREDELGRQYIRSDYLGGEHLLWDFSQALEVGNTICYGYWGLKTYEDGTRGMGWIESVVRIHDIGTYVLVDGTEVPIVNDQFIWGYGSKSTDYFLHFWYDAQEEDGRATYFFFRDHNGVRVHENEEICSIIIERFGMDLEEVVRMAFNGTLTNIETIAKDTKTSDALYDLQGRRLLHEPEKGIYIKDGRKYLKK